MEILLIEDDPRVVELLARRLPDHSWRVASTREDAEKQLRGNAPDLAICDLRIPPAKGLAPHTDHGLAAFDKLRQVWPGVPVRMLSGFSATHMIDERLQLGGGLVGHHKKDDVDVLLAVVEATQKDFDQLETIEITKRGQTVELSVHEQRLLRRFAAQRGAEAVTVRPLGGKSDSVTLAIVLHEGANDSIQAVAKINAIHAVKDEERRYDDHVAERVAFGRYTPKTVTLANGAGDRAAVFFRLAEGFARNTFDVLRGDPVQAATVVDALREATTAWRVTAVEEMTTVGDIRRFLVRDELMPQLRELAPWATEELDALPVRILRARQHGDMHGENALVNASLEPTLIDFGRCAEAPACLDAVTLEMSAYLQPAADLRLSDWLTTARAATWSDLERFVDDCPIESFVRACRTWAYDAAAGDKEVLATSYSYALRQLRYADVDPNLASAFCFGAARALST